MKIPPQATKVFEGEIFDVYQWQQKLYNESFATFEMLKRPDTLQIIPVVGNKLLLAEEEQPSKGRFYSLLGGRQEKNESPLDGAKRELLEESGIRAEIWQLFATYTPYTKIDWTVHTFIATGCLQQQQPTLDAGEKITIKEVTFDEFSDIVFSPTFRSREFAFDLINMTYRNQKKLEEFKKQLFD